MPPPSSGLFVDLEFPPCLESLVRRGDTPLSRVCDRITWLRPQEICPRPQLFPFSGRYATGRQGILGDCWFLCACSALQKCPQLLQQVFPTGQCTWDDPGYSGRFTCRFWRFGRWVEVTIDDCLPCLGHKLCFSHCHDQAAFWLPLLEKAYAKLHGSYDVLWAGQVVDALIDLTGGLVERWVLEDAQESVKEKMLCRMLELKDHCAISCSVLHSKEGMGDLGEFHAFTITDIQRVVTKPGQELILLRVHNPWGRNCWSGVWGKNGDKWALIDEPDRAQFLENLLDGEFWIDKEEFLQDFSEVTMAFPVDEMANLKSIWTDWPLLHIQQIHGSWIKGQTAGGSRNNASFSDNPTFWLRVKEQSEVYLALMQRQRAEGSDINQSRALISNTSSLCAIGLHIWKVEKRHFNLQKTIQSPVVAGTSLHSYDRQLHLRCDLSSGYYLVIPSTFLRDTERDFLLRVLSTGPLTLSEITSRRPAVKENESELKGTWETQERKGHWKKGVNAGGSRNFASYFLNPTIPFTVPTNAQMVRVTLQQHCQGKPCHAIGFHVYRVPSDSSQSPLMAQEPCASCVPHSHSQEVSMICPLSSGQYIVVPSTYFPDQECDFSVLISTKTDRKSVKCQEILGNFLKEVSVIAVRK
ncbi:calpain-10 [Gastrophryne carolinensis]